MFALLLRHRLLTPLRQASRHRLRVAAVVPEGGGVLSIEIEGQHLTELFTALLASKTSSVLRR